MTSKKGQATTIDLAVSLLLFVVLLSYVIYFREDAVNSKNEVEKKMRFYEELISLSDSLILSEGIPTDWDVRYSETADVKSVLAPGLAKQAYVLSREKLANLSSMNYSQQKAFLRTYYGFFLTIRDLEGDLIYSIGNYSQNSRYIQGIERYAVYDNTPVRVRLYLYE